MESTDDARGLVQLSQMDVAVLHYQDQGFQHYDCVSFQGGTLHMSADSCARLLSASPLDAVPANNADCVSEGQLQRDVDEDEHGMPPRW